MNLISSTTGLFPELSCICLNYAYNVDLLKQESVICNPTFNCAQYDYVCDNDKKTRLKIDGMNAKNCLYKHVSFFESSFFNVIFENCVFIDVSFRRAIIYDCRFINCHTHNCIFADAKFRNLSQKDTMHFNIYQNGIQGIRSIN
jgi:uncharacterized protein YjbI with pentapeptide repeats